MWYNIMWYKTNELKDVNEIKIVVPKRTRKGRNKMKNFMKNFKLSRYKVSYTRNNINCYAYCNQVSTRKLISEHGKNHMITSIIDTRTGEEIWDK